MEIQKLEQCEALQTICIPDPTAEIVTGYTSDLLSDVLANAEEDSVLITIQAHKNSIAVSSIAGCNAIVVCNDREIPEDMVTSARENDVALFHTDLSQFESSLLIGKLLELD